MIVTLFLSRLALSIALAAGMTRLAIRRRWILAGVFLSLLVFMVLWMLPWIAPLPLRIALFYPAMIVLVAHVARDA